MGFLRRLFGAKKPAPQPDVSASKPGKDSKRRWSFGKNSNKDKSLTQQPPPPPSSAVNHHYDPSSSLDANKHAIAVAAATAAVAEAALAAAHAAAEVVRLTSTTGGGSSASSSRPHADAAAHVGLRRWQDETAAVKIQSAFRGYLARRALRALKALVKLQALVRGHIVRKQTADMLRRMQTLVRLQAQARATRVHFSADNNFMHSFKSPLSHYPVPEEYEHPLRAYSTKFDGSSILKRCSSNANFRNSDWERSRFGSNWLESWMEENVHNQTRDATMRNNGHNINIMDDEKSDKILEVDTWKPNFNPHHHSSSFQKPHYYFTSDYNNDKNFMAYESPSKRSSSREVLPLSSLKLHKGKEEAVSSRTADNSPQPFSTSSSRHGIRKGPFTPTRSECSWGFFSGYVGHPNYMANTESSRAKVRSQSAPRQRLDYDRYGSTRRSTIQGLWDVVGPSNNSERDYCDLRNKAYPPSSRFNRIESTNLR